MKATTRQGYSDPNRKTAQGYTSWRVSGSDLDGARLEVGVDLVVDHLGAFTLGVTVF